MWEWLLGEWVTRTLDYKPPKRSVTERALYFMLGAAVWCVLATLANIWWLVQPPTLSPGASSLFTAWQLGYMAAFLAGFANFWARACRWVVTLFLIALVPADIVVLFNCVQGDSTDITLAVTVFATGTMKLIGMGILLSGLGAEITLASWRARRFSELIGLSKSPEEAKRILKLEEDAMKPL